MEDYPHLIITSAPRSGSTPLAKLLGQQEKVFVTNELGFYDDWFNTNKWRNFINSREWINFVANKEIFEAHGLDLYKFREEVIKQKMSGQQIFRWFFHNTKALLIGDKCPITYLNNMIRFEKIFPNAKFIIAVRDGRDVIASQIRGFHRWPPGDPDHAPHWMKKTVKEAQPLWLNVSKNIVRAEKIIPPHKLLIFRYEDAVLDTNTFCLQLSDFLGVDIYNINDYFKSTNMGKWQESHPNLMNELSSEFKAMLNNFGY